MMNGERTIGLCLCCVRTQNGAAPAPFRRHMRCEVSVQVGRRAARCHLRSCATWALARQAASVVRLSRERSAVAAADMRCQVSDSNTTFPTCILLAVWHRHSLHLSSSWSMSMSTNDVALAAMGMPCFQAPPRSGPGRRNLWRLADWISPHHAPPLRHQPLLSHSLVLLPQPGLQYPYSLSLGHPSLPTMPLSTH